MDIESSSSTQQTSHNAAADSAAQASPHAAECPCVATAPMAVSTDTVAPPDIATTAAMLDGPAARSQVAALPQIFVRRLGWLTMFWNLRSLQRGWQFLSLSIITSKQDRPVTGRRNAKIQRLSKMRLERCGPASTPMETSHRSLPAPGFTRNSKRNGTGIPS